MNSGVSVKKQLREGARKYLPKPIKDLIRQFLDIIVQYNFFSDTDRIVKKVFDFEKPDALILYGDRVLVYVPSAVKWARKNNKAIIDIQIAVSNENFLYKSFRQKSLYFSTKNPLNYLFGLLFPRYKKKFDTETVLFYSWSMIFVLWLKGMLPKNPWYLGQSWADRYLMISRQTESDLKKSCGYEALSTVTGQFSHDALYSVYENRKELRMALLNKYFQTDSQSEIIIFGMPQFYEHHLMDEKRASEEIGYILENLSNFKDKLILLSLHPKMPYEKYSYLNSKYRNIRVMKEERLSGSLPAADYFVSVFESTVTWALMCNIVSIFVDYYDLGFDLSKYPSVQILKNKQSFSADMKDIFNRKEAILRINTQSIMNLPPFDGKSGERILLEITGAVNEKKHQTAK